MQLISLLLGICLLSCSASKEGNAPKTITTDLQPFTSTPPIDSMEVKWYADHFDFPVGKPNGKGYYNAQGFGKNHHLGDDWNGRNGGNSDLGDPIYSIANGWVSLSENIGGDWGNVVRIIHFLPDSIMVESLYAHCDTLLVKEGEWVKIGQQIGTIGDAHGRYPAHLHLELRKNPGMPIGKGYSSNTTGYLDPTKFIREHR